MKKKLPIFLAVLMFITVALPIKAQNDQEAYQKLQNYNVFLEGNHSSEKADLEGGMAVMGDSSFGQELETYSYGAMFSPETNIVGQPYDDEELVSLLIGGKVHRIHSDKIITMPSTSKNGKLHGRFLASDQSHQDSKAAFTNGNVEELREEQKVILSDEDIKAYFKNLQKQNSQVQTKLHDLTSSLEDTGLETLGETWLDGKLVTYRMYRSNLDENVMVINIPPQKVDGEYETIVHSFGLDLDAPELEDVEQFIVTSFDLEGTTRQHSQKIAFKGNFLYKKNGSIMVLPYEDMGRYVEKVVNYFPDAKQVTNYFDAKAYNIFHNPDAKQTDESSTGISEEGKTLYYRDYLKQYATGNSNNGSAEQGGGASIVGAVVAPKATVILTGSAINGFLSAKNLHQRNGAEIHHFRNKWIFENLETPKGSVRLEKYYRDGDEEKPLSGAVFKLFRMEAGQRLFYTQDKQWTLGEENTEFTTDEDGVLEFKELEFGTYYLWEVKAPDGFEQDKKTIREINIGPESETVTLRWENYQKASLKRKIKIIKKSSLDNERLEGAEFIVRRESKHKDQGPYEYLMQYISGDGETIYRGFVSNILLATHFTTNKDGEVVIEDLPDTKLELLEVKAPEGHVVENPVIPIEADQENDHIELEIKNTKEPQQLYKYQLMKVDKNNVDTALKGAEFVLKQHGFYYKGGSSLEDSSWTADIKEAHHFISNESGDVLIDTTDGFGFEEGRYLMEEVKAPEGYELLEEPFSIHIPSKMAYVVMNEKLGSFSVQKVNKQGKDLSGARFVLLQNGQYYTGEKNALWSSNHEKAKVFETDQNGHFKVDKLAYGTYYLREIVAPEGYDLLEEDVEITIDESHLNKTYKIENSQTIPWTPIDPLGSFKVKKLNHQGESLEGAEFVLLHKGQYYTGDVDKLWTNNKDEAKKMISDAGGAFEVKSLPYGTYQLREIKAPEGYDLLEKDIEITINEQQNNQSYEVKNVKSTPWLPIEPLGSFSVTKVDKEANTLEGAEFVLLSQGKYYTGDPDNRWTNDVSQAAVYKSDANGAFKVTSLPYGVYQLREVKAPEGYDLLEEDVEITIDESHLNKTYKIENSQTIPWTPIDPLGSFKVKKLNHQGESLEGAEFVLLHKGQYYTGDVDKLWTNNKDEAKKMISDAGGAFEVKSLPYGTYKLREIKAPEGYDLLEKDIEITINEQQNNQSYEVKNVKSTPWLPIEPLGSFSVTKVDKEANTLEGAEFVLLSQGKYYTGDPDNRWTNDVSQAAVYKSDANGAFKVTSLPYGIYQLREVKAPEGYDLLEEDVEITIDESHLNKTYKIENSQTIPWTPIDPLGSFKVKKLNHQGESLEGAEFVLLHKGQYYTGDVDKLWTNNKDEAKKMISDAGGAFEVKSLPYGTYQLREIKAPEGYDLLEKDIEITINEQQNNQSYEVKNVKSTPWLPIEPLGSFSVLKEDPDGNRLLGAKFILMHDGQYYTGNRESLWSSDQKDAELLVTNEKGFFRVDSLPYGHYILKEIEAPEGYQLLEDVLEFNIHDQLVDATYSVENKKVEPWTPIEPMASFEVEKVDTEGKHLEGAEFHLMYKGQYYTGKRDAMWTSDQKGAKVLVTDANGHFAVNSLPYGDYVLTEIKAPEGYALLEEPVKFSLDSTHFKESLRITNKKVEPWTPIEPMASFEVEKVDTEGKHLEGAEFHLMYKGQYYTGKRDAMWTSDQKGAKVLVTDANGHFAVNSLPYGDYVLTEIKAPEGYSLLEEPVKFSLDAEKSQFSLKIENKAIDSPIIEEKLGKIRVYKMDADTQALLSGAQFVLKQDGLYYTGKAWSKYYKDALVLESNEHGFFEVNGLAMGVYELVEVKAPNGYVLNKEVIDFDLSEDNFDKEIVVKNTPVKEKLPTTGISNTSTYIFIALIVVGLILYLWAKRRDR